MTAAANTTALAFQGSGTPGNVITLLFEPGTVVQAPYFPPSVGGSTNCGGGICGQGRSYISSSHGGANGIVQNTANGTAGSYSNSKSSELIDIHNCFNCTVQNLSLLNVYARKSATHNGY